LRTLLAGTVVVAVLLSGCSGDSSEDPTAPDLRSAASAQAPDLSAALAAQSRHTGRLMAMQGVVGTAVALNSAGKPAVEIFTVDAAVSGLPASLDGVPVVSQAVGRIFARSDPTTRARPAPIGFSVGHPDITAGTIGARVKDAAGNVYLLSNNHVLANSNNANLNDSALQPGPYDGGSDPVDRIGGLSDFEVLNLGLGGFEVDPPTNTMDAAIALSSTAVLSNSTPTDDGYGVPSSTLFADGNGDGSFDNVSQLLSVPVQKYGRTTKLTQGRVTQVSVTIDVCYDIFCLFVGRFLDQIGICCADFSDGGDSGSLVVSSDVGRNPVGLLFAGGDGLTFANRIDLVLQRFKVSIDASASPPPPPPPPVDLSMHVGDLDGLGSVQGRTWAVSVTIKIEDGSHNPVSGATVSGAFSAGANGNASCTTGTSGTCFVTKSRLKSSSVTFRVTNVTRSTRTYQSASNQDPDGDSDGTTIIVTRP
jgi:hypothetical protein